MKKNVRLYDAFENLKTCKVPVNFCADGHYIYYFSPLYSDWLSLWNP